MSEQTQNPTRENSPFNDIFFTAARRFAEDIMLLVPELAGLAIVPAWQLSQPQLPYGVIRGQNGPLHTPVEVMHMAQQLHGALQHVMIAAAATLKSVDDQLGVLAREIRAKESELHDRTAAGEHESGE